MCSNKRIRFRKWWPVVWVAALLILGLGGWLSGIGHAQAPDGSSSRRVQATLGTAFTYQGRLTDGGQPADGTYDFRFRLFDAASGGSQVGSTVTRSGVRVAEGLFTVELDFGDVFDGRALWLEVGVKRATESSYTVLGRQKLTATPYAVFAQGAPWSGIQGVPAGFADGVDNDSGGDITKVTAGTGLSGGGDSGDVTLSLADSYRLPQTCNNGQIPEWNGTTWTCGNDDVGTGGGGGDITAVNAGTGLTGGGTSGDVTLSLDTSYTDGRYYTRSALQSSGQAQVHWGNLTNVPAGLADGDDDTTYSAGSGLNLSGTQFSVDTAVIQARVTGVCPAGQSIREIRQDGTVVCEVDNDSGGDITGVTAGTGLSGGGTTGTITLTLDTSYTDGRYYTQSALQSSGQAQVHWGNLTNVPAGFADGVDNDSGGDITGVTAGTGLSGGGSSGDVALSLAESYRLPQTCNSGQVAKWDGTVWNCGNDNDSGGDITGVTAGTGLSGGGTTGAITLTLDTSYTDGRYYTQSALQSSGQAQVHWGNLTNVPAGFADGVDNDSGGDITGVTAGTGLSGGGTTGTITLTLDTSYTDGRYWKLGGNGGTDPVNHFLGTTDSVSLTLRVNNTAALRLIPSLGTPNIVGGYQGNAADALAQGVTIGGGGTSGAVNQVTVDFGTVSGGQGNTVSGGYATVGGGRSNTAGNWDATVSGGQGNSANGDSATVSGGQGNTAGGNYATVGGGRSNTAGNWDATVSGGQGNTAGGNYATVGGGRNNIANGDGAVVPGGEDNTAAGAVSFAAGTQARAVHAGAFVWGDNTLADIYSPADNTFIVRANGGIWFGQATTALTPTIGTNAFIDTSTGAYLSTGGTWTNASDRNAKENFQPVDPQEVLEKVVDLPIQSWNYKAEDDTVRHMGPTAQDFYAAFGLGNSDTSISTVDADGVALAAIQALYWENRAQETRIAQLEQRIDALEAQLQALEARLARLEARDSTRR